MLKKFAEATVIGAEIATRNAVGLVKASHRAVFNYEPREGFLYVRSRMISYSLCFRSMYRFWASLRQARQWRTPPRSYVFSGVNS